MSVVIDRRRTMMAMKKLASVVWLRIERVPDLAADLTIPVILITSGLLVMGLALVG